MAVAKIFGIGFLGIAVPFAGEYATPPDVLERLADAADPREQVNEIEPAFFVAFRSEREKLLQCKAGLVTHTGASCTTAANSLTIIGGYVLIAGKIS